MVVKGEQKPIMRKSTKNVITRWRVHVKKTKNMSKRKALLFMIDAIENRIYMYGKELDEE